jgi:hypothetical protein
MNYLAAAKERNLDLAQLPKTLQKKIQELESLNAEFLESKVPKEKLSPKEIESYNMIQEKIEELDAYLVKKVKNFDATKYQARLDSFNKMMEQRKSKKGEDGIDAIIDDGGIADLKESVQIEPEKFEPQQVKATPVQVQEPVQVREPEPRPEPQQQVEEEYEVEEFDKVGDAKPKKVVSKGMLLMGVGFLLLTWGAVNVFKDRRG